MFILYMKVVNSSQSAGFTKCRIIPAIYWMTRGARYYRYTDKPRCGLEKIRIAIRFGRIGSLGNLRQFP